MQPVPDSGDGNLIQAARGFFSVPRNKRDGGIFFQKLSGCRNLFFLKLEFAADPGNVFRVS